MNCPTCNTKMAQMFYETSFKCPNLCDKQQTVSQAEDLDWYDYDSSNFGIGFKLFSSYVTQGLEETLQLIRDRHGDPDWFNIYKVLPDSQPVRTKTRRWATDGYEIISLVKRRTR